MGNSKVSKYHSWPIKRKVMLPVPDTEDPGSLQFVMAGVPQTPTPETGIDHPRQRGSKQWPFTLFSEIRQSSNLENSKFFEKFKILQSRWRNDQVLRSMEVGVGWLPFQSSLAEREVLPAGILLQSSNHTRPQGPEL